MELGELIEKIEKVMTVIQENDEEILSIMIEYNDLTEGIIKGYINQAAFTPFSIPIIMKNAFNFAFVMGIVVGKGYGSDILDSVNLDTDIWGSVRDYLTDEEE